MAKILVVDDEDAVRRALERIVRRMGHEVTSASHPRAALAMAIANPPDLALIDYRMPEMDGGELLQALHERLGPRSPRAVFVSATPPTDLIEKLGPALGGFFGAVAKPFQLEELRAAIEHALGA